MPQTRIAILRIEISPEGNVSCNLSGQITPAEAYWAMADMQKKLIDNAHREGIMPNSFEDILSGKRRLNTGV